VQAEGRPGMALSRLGKLHPLVAGLSKAHPRAPG
jgi:hypothetical protein